MPHSRPRMRCCFYRLFHIRLLSFYISVIFFFWYYYRHAAILNIFSRDACDSADVLTLSDVSCLLGETISVSMPNSSQTLWVTKSITATFIFRFAAINSKLLSEIPIFCKHLLSERKEVNCNISSADKVMLLIVVGYVHRLSHTDKSVVRISYVEQRESMMSECSIQCLPTNMLIFSISSEGLWFGFNLHNWSI